MAALAAIALGLVLGVLAGGDLRNLGHVGLRLEIPLLIAFVIQGLARGRVPALASAGVYGLGVWVVVSCLLCVLLTANWRRPGMAVAWVGVMVNLVVVLANGAMPVMVASGSGVPSSIASAIRASSGFYQLSGGATVFGLFGDVIPLPLGRVSYFSVGDVLLAVGVVAYLIFGSVRAPQTAEIAPEGMKESSESAGTIDFHAPMH